MRTKKITKIPRPRDSPQGSNQIPISHNYPSDPNLMQFSPKLTKPVNERYPYEVGKRFDTPQKDLNFSNTFDMFYGTLDNTAPATATQQKAMFHQTQNSTDPNNAVMNSKSNYFDLMSEHNSDENFAKMKKTSEKADENEDDTSKYELSELSLPAHVLPLESPSMSIAPGNPFQSSQLKELYGRPDVVDFGKNHIYNPNKEFKRFQSMSNNMARSSQESQALQPTNMINPSNIDLVPKNTPPNVDIVRLANMSNQFIRTISELSKTSSNNHAKEDLLPAHPQDISLSIPHPVPNHHYN